MTKLLYYPAKDLNLNFIEMEIDKFNTNGIIFNTKIENICTSQVNDIFVVTIVYDREFTLFAKILFTILGLSSIILILYMMLLFRI